MLKLARTLAVLLLAAAAWTQSAPSPTPVTGPPKVVLLVYQQFLPGKAGPRQALEVDTARNFDRLAVPVSWIELESVTGPAQALFFDPANSFADLDKAGTILAQLYSSTPDIAQNQQRIEETVASSRTVTAFRRDDLSLRADTINLAKARFLRVRMAQINPSAEHSFASAIAASIRASAKDEPASAWVAYQVNAGLPDMTFLFVEALHTMDDLDRGLSHAGAELDWIGGAASSEVNLFAIHPEMSHVSRDFAAADPNYWTPRSIP